MALHNRPVLLVQYVIDSVFRTSYTIWHSFHSSFIPSIVIYIIWVDWQLVYGFFGVFFIKNLLFFPFFFFLKKRATSIAPPAATYTRLFLAYPPCSSFVFFYFSLFSSYHIIRLDLCFFLDFGVLILFSFFFSFFHSAARFTSMFSCFPLPLFASHLRRTTYVPRSPTVILSHAVPVAITIPHSQEYDQPCAAVFDTGLEQMD